MLERFGTLKHIAMRHLLVISFTTVLSARTFATGPSFSCAHVTSEVNKLICAFSALDRELANVFTNMRGQPLDQKKLRADAHTWLASLLQDCKDESCIEARYKGRLAELRDRSLKAASPAVYEETPPFPAPAATFNQVRALAYGM